MTREDKKLIKKFDKEMKEKLELYHRIRSTPYSYHRVGKLVGMETKATKKEIEQDRKRVKRLYP